MSLKVSYLKCIFRVHDQIKTVEENNIKKKKVKRLQLRNLNR